MPGTRRDKGDVWSYRASPSSFLVRDGDGVANDGLCDGATRPHGVRPSVVDAVEHGIHDR